MRGKRSKAVPALAPVSVVILAAGEGKRMKSALPKVLQPLAGRPLLAHVIEAARKLAPDAIHVVYGHGGANVRAALAHEHVGWVEQAQQLGTGHAVLTALPHIADDQTVLVLYGDVPLIRAQTLAELHRAVRAQVPGAAYRQASRPGRLRARRAFQGTGAADR